jgi:hypothetical protein
MTTDVRRESEFTAEELVEIAQRNHLWINAFTIIRPTDEILTEIGRWVLLVLRESRVRNDLTGLTPIAYLSVNAS